MNKFIIFDTETTGLPKNWNAPADQVDNWPRIIQLAYGIFDHEGHCLKQVNNLIKPDGWEIPKEKFWIDNGFTTETNAEKGIPISDALAEFLSDALQCNFRVAHNISFDAKIIRSELIRGGNNIELKSEKICTMKSSTSHVGLAGNKWPKLIELHYHLFEEDFEGAHDAHADVMACARCLFELIRLGVITIPEPKAVTN